MFKYLSLYHHIDLILLTGAQESYFTYSAQEQPIVDHNILFRAGQGADSTETFTPRTLIYDLKGGFGSLRKFNALYQTETETIQAQGLWDGLTSAQHLDPIPPSRYQTLLDQGLPTFQLHEDDVRYWSDFNRVFYHPRSAVQLSQYELNSQLMPFEKWAVGEELFHDLDNEEDILDRDLRPFAEECDHMQGFQLITGTDDAWGGFASRYLDGIRDEYGKTSIWTFGIEDGTQVPRHVRSIRLGNAARSMRSLAQQSSAYIGLSTVPRPVPGYINLEGRSEWLTSAFLCSAIESATLPSRLRHTGAQQASLPILEDALNSNGAQKLFELQMSADSVRGPITQTQTNGLSDGLHNGGHSSAMESDFTGNDTSFLPRAQETTYSDLHVFSLIKTHRSKDASAATEGASPEERIRMRLNEESIVEQYSTNLLFPRLDTFPEDLDWMKQEGGIALTTSLRTSSNLKNHVVQLRDQSLGGLDLDERESIYNDLTELANGYSFGFDSGSDSGLDD